MYLRRLWMILGSLLVSLAAPAAVHAQACATFPNQVVLTGGTYDPFSPSGLNLNATGTITINNPTDNAISVVFFVVPDATNTIPVTQVVGTEVGGGGPSPGPLNILLSSPPASIAVDNPSGLDVQFNGGTHSGQATLALQIAGGLSGVTAGTNKVFLDVWYGCKASANQKTVTPTEAPNVLEVDFTVLSALKASLTGYPLDFGDITNVTTDGSGNGLYTTKNAPISGTTELNVQSSGPYQLSWSSQNGYVMTQGGGAISNTNAAVGYTLHFLGNNYSGTSTTPNTTTTSVTCNSATLASPAHQIPVTATLNEATHTPTQTKVGGAYQDTITFTFSPLAAGTSGQTC